jgi:uncharacterized protein (DUF885 family)
MLLTLTIALATQTPMQQLSDEFLKALFQYSPITASTVGYHENGVDQKLDDVSAAARQKRAAWLHDFGQRMEALPAAKIDREDDADRDLLRQTIALDLLNLDEAHDYTRRCDAPLDALGSVFFMMVARDYAPLEKRASDVAARLGEVPRFLKDAQAALTTNVPEFRAAARDDGQGLLDYLEHQLLPAFEKTAAAPALKKSLPAAVAAVKAYLAFVADGGPLAKKPPQTFRYGKALYDKRFGPYLQTDRTPADVLASAERRMVEVKKEMAGLAQKIAGKPDVRAALDATAKDHPTPEQLFPTVREQLARATRFVKEKQLLTLSAHENLQVIETPPFLRSQLGVAAFDGAPPLQPSLGAFFYVTPFPPSWPKEKVESKLREYNRWMLEILTIHEAMPGHYVQFERANEVQPQPRRVLRWVLGAGAYIEGWAVYAQDVMVDAGYANNDPRLRLTNLKMELRALANSILDIKLQSGDLTDEQAMKLMVEDAFQERSEAELKLRRAKLSVTQLCSYFVGMEAWRALRRAAQAQPGFDLKTFHDRALGEGAVTLPMLKKLLTSAR